LGCTFVEFIPRSPIIQACELEGRAVVEHAPESQEAAIFRKLARKVMENEMKVIPTPVEELPELEELYRKHLALAEVLRVE
jgi:nitrogenase iron protein NifH